MCGGGSKQAKQAAQQSAAQNAATLAMVQAQQEETRRLAQEQIAANQQAAQEQTAAILAAAQMQQEGLITALGEQTAQQTKATMDAAHLQATLQQQALDMQRQALADAKLERDSKAQQAKSPNLKKIADRVVKSGRSGIMSTVLAGRGGVNPAQLTLGKTTLLGA